MGKQYQVEILVQHTSIHQSYSNVGNMRSVLFISIFAITFNALSGLKCKDDSECLTLDDMGAGWGGFFNGAANAPCLTMSWSKGADDLWCFNSKGGSLKPCTCWDDTLSFDNKWCNTGKYNEGHTMCKYEDSVQASCGSYTLTGIDSQAVKDAIVDKHNELRARVANGKTGVIGHYTQVVWAETTDVGCGYIASSKGSYMACNYGPGGNVAGKRVYETGKPGSKCPTKKTSQGLCA